MWRHLRDGHYFGLRSRRVRISAVYRNAAAGLAVFWHVAIERTPAGSFTSRARFASLQLAPRGGGGGGGAWWAAPAFMPGADTAACLCALIVAVHAAQLIGAGVGVTAGAQLPPRHRAPPPLLAAVAALGTGTVALYFVSAGAHARALVAMQPYIERAPGGVATGGALYSDLHAEARMLLPPKVPLAAASTGTGAITPSEASVGAASGEECTVPNPERSAEQGVDVATAREATPAWQLPSDYRGRQTFVELQVRPPPPACLGVHKPLGTTPLQPPDFMFPRAAVTPRAACRPRPTAPRAPRSRRAARAPPPSSPRSCS